MVCAIFVMSVATAGVATGQSSPVLAIVAPGQGAQTPGFLTPWLEDPVAASLLDSLALAAEVDLVGHGTTSDAETIRQTDIAQPLLVAAGILTGQAIAGSLPVTAGVVAGHSVGEITAAALTGVLSPTDAMRFVGERGRGMAAASGLRPTSMMAVVGGDPDEVLASIEAAGLTPANNNGSGQIVAAGTVEQLAVLTDNPPARARLIQLSVAGAFHTVHMEPAVARLAALAAELAPDDPSTRLLSNADGAIVGDGREAVDRLVRQVANPVRWDLCMQTMAGLGVTGILELAPAGTLTGIAKRNLKGVALFNLNTPDQLDDARAFVSTHTEEADK